jgi:hypothetical protein
MPEYRGEPIDCAVSGLRGWGSACDTGGGYSQVFIGTILSVAEWPDTERALRVKPTESFLGQENGDLTVITREGPCFEALQELKFEPGDEWLFYLRTDNQTKHLVMQFGDGSGPVGNEQDAITRLRRLAKMENTGLIMGDVTEPSWDGKAWKDDAPVPSHKLILKRNDDGSKFTAVTDSKGHYEFQPLPMGKYNLTPNTAEGKWALGGSVDITARSCAAYDFELKPDGKISGHVTTTDGRPVPYASVEAVKMLRDHGADQVSTTADENGYFEIEGLDPAVYLVGIGIGMQHDSPEWKSRVYFPEGRTEESAAKVELGLAEKRADIDIRIPTSPAQ